MKKIILGLFLFLIAIKVEALEYGVWTDEVSTNENSRVVASETRYKWYKKDIINSEDYYIEGENNPEYQFMYNDYIYSEWSDWQDVSPENKQNRDIERKLANRYRTLKKVRYLFLEDFQGGYLSYRIAELNVLINNVEKDVHMECNDCSLNFNADVRDNLLIDNAYIKNGGNLMIDLGDYYLISDIRLELYMYDFRIITKKFNLYYNIGTTLDDGNIGFKEIDIYVISDDSNNPEKHLIIADNTFISNYTYDDWIYIDGYLNGTYYRQMQVLNMYRYRDKKYRYYKEVLTYTDDYYSNYNGTNYEKDETTATTYYIYEYVNPIISPPIEEDDSMNDISEPIIDVPEEGSNNSSNEIDENESKVDNSIINQDNSSPLDESDNQSIVVASNKLDKEIVIASNILTPKIEQSSITNNSSNENLIGTDSDERIDNNTNSIEKASEITKEKITNINKKNNIDFATIIKSKVFLISLFVIIFIFTILFKLRHHILSHQN